MILNVNSALIMSCSSTLNLRGSNVAYSSIKPAKKKKKKTQVRSFCVSVPLGPPRSKMSGQAPALVDYVHLGFPPYKSQVMCSSAVCLSFILTIITFNGWKIMKADIFIPADGWCTSLTLVFWQIWESAKKKKKKSTWVRLWVQGQMHKNI